eukprot:2431873-Rhodomonas_salina.1
MRECGHHVVAVPGPQPEFTSRYAAECQCYWYPPSAVPRCNDNKCLPWRESVARARGTRT